MKLILKKYFLNIPLVLIISLLFISCEDTLIGPDPQNTPINNFDILWKEFDRYYPAFELKHIDWNGLNASFRKRITPGDSEPQLWDCIGGMLNYLDDIHVFMYNKDHSWYYNSSSNGLYEIQFNIELIEYKYLKENYKTAGGGKFIYGKFPGDSIGYIYIKVFDGTDNWVADIDRIITELADVKYMVIDVRDNYGGYETNLKYIASSFIDKPITYMKEMSRSGPGHNDFTAPYYHTITPKIFGPHFNKPTVILTNKYSASAAEIFALIFKNVPNSIQIGDRTAGGIGVSYRFFELPNGWTYNMPSSLCLSPEGESFEQKGIVPDIYIYNVPYASIDSILEYTLQYYLSENGNKLKNKKK